MHVQVAAQPRPDLVSRPGLLRVGRGRVELEPLEIAGDAAGQRLGDDPRRGVADARQLAQPALLRPLAELRGIHRADDVGGPSERLDLVGGRLLPLEQEGDAVQRVERLHEPEGTLPGWLRTETRFPWTA